MSPTASPQSKAKAAAATDGGEAAAAPAKSKKKLIIIGVGVLLVAAAAWYFLLRTPAAAAEAPPEPGVVTPLDSISINLTEGHYLRLGIALQSTAESAEAPDGSKALDLAISTFTGQPVAVLADPKARDDLKHKLEAEVSEAYEKKVMGIYFTEFVTQ